MSSDNQGSKSPLLHLYLDETGSRHLDKQPPETAHGFDWFAMGGILMNAEDEAPAKVLYDGLIQRWPQIRHPLHFTDMRAEKKGFAWLGRIDDDERDRFWTEYRSFLTALPVIGSACVIDRPGYRARGYGGREGEQKWMLCRSAFDILVERAAKFAQLKGRRLCVFYERADPKTDGIVESYFKDIKTNGTEFNAENSHKYNPLSSGEFQSTLVSIEGKYKTSKMMQIADSYLYAIARGSYERKFHAYRRIAERGKLVTTQVEIALAPTLGVKRYCFELAEAKKTNKNGRV